MKQIKNSILFFLVITGLLSSCYEHTEGCRDINALNFDVTADKDCENDCCKYPDVYINFRLTNDSITIDTNTVLVNDFSDTFRIKYFRMYLSGFKLVNKQNDTLSLSNKIKIGKNLNNQLEYKNIDFTVAKIKAIPRSYKLGSLLKLDEYKELIFNFGIDPTVNHSILDKVSISNPLSIKENDMYIDTVFGYYFLKMEIEMQDSNIKYENIIGDEYLTTISIESPLNFRERENHYINLNLDINKWLLSVDINKTDAEIKAILIDNLDKSITIR